jgi:hypothetical protein
MKKILTGIILSISLLSSCYYDDKNLLNPDLVICDTSLVTYSGSVNPVINAYCTSCHSGANAPLGIDLSTYAGVNSQVINGKLLASINHSAGVSAMPKNGIKLSACNISKIRIWITSGAKNN